MKNILKYISLIFVILFLFAILIVSRISGMKEYRSRTCKGIKICIVDSSYIGFITKADILRVLANKHFNYMGKAIDSINLKHIESWLKTLNSIKSADAYVSNDTYLHIKVHQREPIVQLNTDKGIYYIDENSYYFPKIKEYKHRIPILYGSIPITINKQGYASDKKSKYWMQNLINMLKFMKENDIWGKGIAKIEVDNQANLCLKPRIGKESFIFGYPDHYEEKFALIEDYYRYIANSSVIDKKYKTINVNYKGQIICK